MKAQPCKFISGEGYVDCPKEEATHLTIRVPGPSGRMTLPVQISGTRGGTMSWSWNGDTEKPTLRPGVLTAGHGHRSSDNNWRCHTWIKDGKAEFLGDFSREYVGHTLDLVDF
jgi:hypothetical protein